MKLIKDETGQQENPIILILTVMFFIIVMSLVLIVAGTFMDEFLALVTDLRVSNPLGSWGNAMMDALPLKYAPYVFYVPGLFILIVIVWAVKSVIKRHEYTRGNTQYMTEEDEF